MRTETKTITPQYAEHLLSANHGNRKVRPDHVEYLVGLLERREWELTHQGIAFSTDGVLLDGQHRLMAIVKSGIPAEMSIAWGCPSKSFKALDSGLTRSISDHTGMGTLIAATLRFAVAIALGGRAASRRISPAQIEEMAASRVGAGIFRIREHTKTTAKVFSSSTGTLCAAVMWNHYMMCGKTNAADYVLSTYHNLVAGNFSLVPPSANRYIKAAGSRLTLQKPEQTFFAMRAYNYELRNGDRYQLTENTVADACADLREMVISQFAEKPVLSAERAA